MDLNRFESLIGTDNLNKVRSLNILLIGIGGVGGYTLESLVRSGVNNITIVDFDTIDSSNINRQIICTSNNIGKYKVIEALERYKSINPSINIVAIKNKIDNNSISNIDFKSYDYIIDACDDTSAKKLIIEEALKNNVTVISSMGTAKKTDGSKVYITTLDKTSYDPLAKKMRSLIDKKMQRKVNVVTSSEIPKKSDVLCSSSFVPGIAGLMITSFIINDVIKKR